MSDKKSSFGEHLQAGRARRHFRSKKYISEDF